MAEVAGLVLGGILLAMWVLEKYAEPYEEFHNYRISIETFRANLSLQNKQLQLTLSNVGLSGEPSADELRECFETKFPGISRELMFIVLRMNEVVARLMQDLEVDVNRGPNTLPDKAQWEWRRVKHSLTTKKRNKVIDDLRHWNDDLRRSLEKSELPAEDSSRKVQDLKRRFDLRRCGSIRQCLDSLHQALESGLRCGCSSPHQAAIDLDWEAYSSTEAASFKMALSYTEDGNQAGGPGSWRKVRLLSQIRDKMFISSPEPPTPPPPSTISTMSSEGSFRSKVTRFKLALRPARPSPPPSSKILSRQSTLVPEPAASEITSLCDAVCSVDGQPWSLAGYIRSYVDETERHFSLNHAEADLPRIVRSVSLKSLLSSRDAAAEEKRPCLLLSAKQRYGIAASIAWSVLHLSGSSWLGDHWDQDQAGIFLEETKTGREMLSQHPWASSIFSPPAATLAKQPMNDFKHLIPDKSIFALGILLIELCINNSFAGSQKAGDESTSISVLNDYQTALSKLDEVYRLAGDSYGYAAERCVKYSFQGQNPYRDFENPQFQQQFHDAVVAPVQATYLMYPDSALAT